LPIEGASLCRLDRKQEGLDGSAQLFLVTLTYSGSLCPDGTSCMALDPSLPNVDYHRSCEYLEEWGYP